MLGWSQPDWEIMNDIDLLRETSRAYDMVFKSAVEFSCIKAAYDLALFKVMNGKAHTLEELANVTESVPARLERFMITLQQLGLVQQGDGKWSLTPFAEQFFVESEERRNLTMTPHLVYMSDLAERFFMRLSDAVRGQVDLTSLVPYPPTTPEESLYYEKIHRSNVHFPIKLMQDHAKLEGVRHMVDVGGGIGDIASALCEQYPQLQVTLINLPSALDLVRDNVVSRGLGDRITPMALDMYKDPYPQCDAVLFGRILYPMNDQFCTMMCQKAFEAIEPGGRVMILDLIISDPEAPNYDYLTHYICSIGLNFSVLDFKSHAIYPDILRRVGFEDVTFHEAYDHVLYQAVKPQA